MRWTSSQHSQWDGRTLIVYGSSQGGFRALAAAGLDEHVTRAHVRSLNHRPSSRLATCPPWAEMESQTPLRSRHATLTVNFATQAKCQGAALTVGYIDTACPPTSVYAAYNALRSTRKTSMPMS